jgi:lipoprotein-releasing system permease protein
LPPPYELHLALRYLRFHRGQTFLSIITAISMLGVAVGTAALVIALSLMAGFVEDVRERIQRGSAHLTVTRADSPVFVDADAMMRRLEADREVMASAAVLHTPALVAVDATNSSGFAELLGIEPVAHLEAIPRPDPDQAAALRRLDEPPVAGRARVVLGRELALRLGVVEGDTVRVLVPEVTLAPWGALPRSQLFEVAGTYSSEQFQEDARRAFVNLGDLRRLLRADGVTSWIDVRLNDLRRLDATKQRLRVELGPSWLVGDLIEANADILKALNTEKVLLFLAIGLIVVVAALNIVSTLILMVVDKMKEIGALTAMGARPKSIATVFMLQGLIIGVSGTAAGLALGTALSWWLDRYAIIKLNPEVYFLDRVPFVTQPRDLVFVGLAGVLISFLATLYPATRAARLDPIEAIRHE